MHSSCRNSNLPFDIYSFNILFFHVELEVQKEKGEKEKVLHKIN